MKSRHGASFTWPGQGFQSAFVAAYKLLEQVALACFDVITTSIYDDRGGVWVSSAGRAYPVGVAGRHGASVVASCDGRRGAARVT